MIAPDVVRLPREAYKDAAEIIERESPPTTPVLAYMRQPLGLAFYVEPRAVQPLEATDVVRQRVRRRQRRSFFVVQPFTLEEVDVPCLARPGVSIIAFASTRAAKR